MAKSKTVWFGMKLTPAQKKKIKDLARRDGTSAKETVMRLVEQAIAQDTIDAPDESFLSGIEQIIGSVEGSSDLASNPKHMEGFGT